MHRAIDREHEIESLRAQGGGVRMMQECTEAEPRSLASEEAQPDDTGDKKQSLLVPGWASFVADSNAWLTISNIQDRRSGDSRAHSG